MDMSFEQETERRRIEWHCESVPSRALSLARPPLTQQIAFRIKIHIHHSLCMPLQRPLTLACFPIPNLDTSILTRRRENVPDGMKRYSRDGAPMTWKRMSMWCTWNPVGVAGGRR